MSDVEDRVVEMKFDNREFEAGVESTIRQLDNLKAALNFGNVSNGLADLENHANNITLDGMASSLDNISSKFSVMGAIGFSVIQDLTKEALDAGKRMGKALLSPIVEGGKKRALALEQAKFQFKGLGLDVDKTMKVALAAVEGTAYGLDAAATVAAQFGASGMKAGKNMTGALRGIAGVAAMTGTSYEDIGQIFTSVAGQGKLMGTQLMQLSSRGVNGAAILAKQMGKTEGQIRQMVTDGKISFKEFAKAMDDAFGKHAQSANKTFEGALANMKSALSRLGASFAAPSFEALRKVFNALTPVIDKVHKGMKPLINVFTEMSEVVSKILVKALKGINFAGFATTMKIFGRGIMNIFYGILRLLAPLKAAFNEVFDSKGGKGLREMALAFQRFSTHLKAGSETLDRFKRIFAGVFATFSIVWKIVSGVARAFATLFGVMGSGSGGVLEFMASIGDAVVAFDAWLEKGDKIQTVLTGIASVIAPVIAFIGKLIGAFATLLTGDVEGFFERIRSAFDVFATTGQEAGGVVGRIIEVVQNGLAALSDFFNNVAGGIFAPIAGLVDILLSNLQTLKDKLTLKPTFDASGFQTGVEKAQELSAIGTVLVAVWKGVSAFFRGIWRVMKAVSGVVQKAIGAIKEWASGLTFEDVLAIINTGFFILLYRQLSKFIGSLNNISGGFRDWSRKISQTLEGLTDGLKTMQNNVRANIILKIAIAIAILAGALFLLSNIKKQKLQMALGAITILFGQLLLSLALFSKLGPLAEVGMTKVAGALVLLAASVWILASAVAKLGGMDWQEMLRGLGAVAGILVALSLFSKFTAANAAGLKSGAGILLLAGAIYILSAAVGKLGAMSDKGNLVQGIGAVAALLAIVAGAMILMGKGAGVEKGAAAALVASAAVVVLAKATQMLAKINAASLGKAVAAMISMLVALSFTLIAMEPTGPGALALITAAGAIAIMTAAIVVLGNMASAKVWSAIAIMFAILGILAAFAGVGLIIAAPLAALGAAAILIGQAMLLGGAGVFLFATGLALLASVGTAAVAVIGAVFTQFIMLIPLFMQQVGLGIRAFAVVIAQSQQEIVDALTVLVGSGLEAVRKLAPQFADTFILLVRTGLRVIRELAPEVIATGFFVLRTLAAAIVKNLPWIIEAGTRIILTLIRGIGAAADRIASAAGNTLIKFLNGVTAWINNNTARINETMRGLAQAMINGLAAGVSGAAMGALDSALSALTDHIPGFLKKAWEIFSPSKVTKRIGVFLLEGLAGGLEDYSSSGLTSSLDKLNKKVVDGIKKQEKLIADARKTIKTEKAKSNPDEEVIKKAQKVLSDATQAKKAYVAAQKKLNGSLKDEQKELTSLAKRYDTVTAKLEKAQEILDKLEATSDKYKDQYNVLPDIDSGTNVQGYIEQVQATDKATQKYKETLDRLLALGLDKDSYEQLLGVGVEGQNFADQLLKGGKGTVSAFNKANNQLETSAGQLGDRASDILNEALYKAGIQAARGLVKGLKDKQNGIQEQMDILAKKMIKSIKKALGIKSPSREFMKVAKFAILGLVKGFDKYTDKAATSAGGLGDRAIDAMKSSLSRVQDALQGEMNMDPTIAPVIDLTQFRRDATKMSSIVDAMPMTADVSYSSAESIAASRQADQVAAQNDLDLAGTAIKFEQNIHSPEPLSTTEIYRRTGNLMAQAKQVVNIPA